MGVKYRILFFYPFILINPLLCFFLSFNLTYHPVFVYDHCPLFTGLCLANWWLLHPQKHFLKVPMSLVPKANGWFPSWPRSTDSWHVLSLPPTSALLQAFSPLSILLSKPNPTYRLSKLLHLVLLSTQALNIPSLQMTSHFLSLAHISHSELLLY